MSRSTTSPGIGEGDAFVLDEVHECCKAIEPAEPSAFEAACFKLAVKDGPVVDLYRSRLDTAGNAKRLVDAARPDNRCQNVIGHIRQIDRIPLGVERSYRQHWLQRLVLHDN